MDATSSSLRSISGARRSARVYPPANALEGCCYHPPQIARANRCAAASVCVQTRARLWNSNASRPAFDRRIRRLEANMGAGCASPLVGAACHPPTALQEAAWPSARAGDANENYEEFIGAKKHRVFELLSHTGPPQGSNSFATG